MAVSQPPEKRQERSAVRVRDRDVPLSRKRKLFSLSSSRVLIYSTLVFVFALRASAVD